jgi:hypothetical protein
MPSHRDRGNTEERGNLGRRQPFKFVQDEHGTPTRGEQVQRTPHIGLRD